MNNFRKLNEKGIIDFICSILMSLVAILNIFSLVSNPSFKNYGALILSIICALFWFISGLLKFKHK